MALQSIININVDFYDKKYILINAKQLDKKTRNILITCYNQGELFPVDYREHSAYIRYRKSDNYGVFNFCEITKDGKVLAELTEQMLASDGICCADLVLVNRGQAEIDVETGEIVAIDRASILSTMTFYIDVSETAIENSEIESSYEYDGLNDLLERAEAEYGEVIRASKSYAVGNAGGFRENENIDNSKYYYEQSLNNLNNAINSEANAKASETNAKTYMNSASNSEKNAKIYMDNAKTYMDKSEEYMNNVKSSEANAKTYMNNTKGYMDNAKISEDNSSVSESNAKISETNSYNSEINAKTSEDNALNSANLAKSYSVGGTGIRENEDVDNAYYYYELVKAVIDGLNGNFIPMGTISFAELETVEKATGFLYNISDDFITDDTFKEGAGKSYTAGVNVYYTADGFWDCLGGSASPIATVDEVKNYLGIK